MERAEFRRLVEEKAEKQIDRLKKVAGRLSTDDEKEAKKLEYVNTIMRAFLADEAAQEAFNNATPDEKIAYVNEVREIIDGIIFPESISHTVIDVLADEEEIQELKEFLTQEAFFLSQMGDSTDRDVLKAEAVRLLADYLEVRGWNQQDALKKGFITEVKKWIDRKLEENLVLEVRSDSSEKEALGYNREQFIDLVEYRADKEIHSCIRNIEYALESSSNSAEGIISETVDDCTNKILGRSGPLLLWDNEFGTKYKKITESEKLILKKWLVELLKVRSQDAVKRGLKKREDRVNREKNRVNKTFPELLADIGVLNPSTDKEVLERQARLGFWLTDELCVLRSYFLYEIKKKTSVWLERSEAPQKWSHFDDNAEVMSRTVAQIYPFALELGLVSESFTDNPELINRIIQEASNLHGLNGIEHQEAEYSNGVISQKLRDGEKKRPMVSVLFKMATESAEKRQKRIEQEARNSLAHLIGEYKKFQRVAKRAKGMTLADGTRFELKTVFDRMNEFPFE